MILVITGPSGSGKTTLSKILLENSIDFKYHKSFTTRDRRDKDDDRFYNFVTQEEFQELLKSDSFIEHEEVYPGAFYGTPNIDLNYIKKTKPFLIMVKDVIGAKKLKQIYGAGCFVVMLKAEDSKIIIERLKFRDGKKLNKKRVTKVNFENNYDDSFADLVLMVDENLPHPTAEIVIDRLERIEWI